MTEIVPFRGIFYDNSRVQGGDVTAPPYDVITPEMREELYRKSPYNIVRVDFGIELPGDSEVENKYTRAAYELEAWEHDGILRRSDKLCFYAYRMDFEAEGRAMSLTGFYGLVKLVPLGEGVYPHEATHSKPKQDRLSLMEHTGCNTSSIYSLVGGQSGDVSGLLSEASAGQPYLSSTDDDGTVHSFWPVEDEALVARLQEALRDAKVFIADGHHRYETALAYQKMMHEQNPGVPEARPYDYVMMFLADIRDPGLAVLPTHRLVTVDAEGIRERLSAHFEFESLAEGTDIVAAIRGRKHAFGLYTEEGSFALIYKGNDHPDVAPVLRDLDVIVLHKLIFGTLLDVGNWGYEMDPDTVKEKVRGGEYDAAFFLNPTAVSDVEQVALEGLRMPPKSTYFYPKVQTGFVINRLK
jgi:uncharacterized protein (DUF1015 family)